MKLTREAANGRRSSLRRTLASAVSVRTPGGVEVGRGVAGRHALERVEMAEVGLDAVGRDSERRSRGKRR